MKTLLTAFSALLFALVWTTPSFAQANVCNQVAGKADTDLRFAYGSKIDFLLRVAAAAQAKGIDPTHFPQTVPGGGVDILNLPGIVQNLAIQRDQALQQVFAAYNQCVANFAPYQNILNVAGFFLTGGMSQVLPQSVTYIDASNLFSGTPLGGPNALIPKARDDILNNLGIGGDVAKIIRDPRCIFGC